MFRLPISAALSSTRDRRGDSASNLRFDYLSRQHCPAPCRGRRNNHYRRFRLPISAALSSTLEQLCPGAQYLVSITYLGSTVQHFCVSFVFSFVKVSITYLGSTVQHSSARVGSSARRVSITYLGSTVQHFWACSPVGVPEKVSITYLGSTVQHAKRLGVSTSSLVSITYLGSTVQHPKNR